jgi:hypothetical protein
MKGILGNCKEQEDKRQSQPVQKAMKILSLAIAIVNSKPEQSSNVIAE